ncbi:MAG: hypothetical protein ABL882_04430 [Sphingopyxis sp.]
MFTGKPDLIDRLVQLLLGLATLVALANGLFMLINPLDWYVFIPTVITTGPPNAHFIRDIGIAYLGCGLLLGYATINPSLRWLAALAGGLWLTLHGALHVYEVAAGICGPAIFWADAPAVLGHPALVWIALVILFVRQRVAPAGLPKPLLLNTFDKMAPGESGYLREISNAPGHAFEKLMHFMPASMHRHAAPAELFHAVRIGATLAEDCGPCALTTAQSALADGVSRDLVNKLLAAAPDDATKTAFAFGQAIARQSADAFILGDDIEANHGRIVRLELTMAAAIVRAFPAMKRGLGLSKSCSVSPLRL